MFQYFIVYDKNTNEVIGKEMAPKHLKISDYLAGNNYPEQSVLTITPDEYELFEEKKDFIGCSVLDGKLKFKA